MIVEFKLGVLVVVMLLFCVVCFMILIYVITLFGENLANF